MGKKKKRTSALGKSPDFSTGNQISCFQDEVIQHLQLLKESDGLVIGLNAVLRGIAKQTLSVVIYISRKGTPNIYHALNIMLRNSDIIFLQLQDIDCILSNTKIPNSTSYGIKRSVMDQPKFSKLLEKINIAKNSRKSNKGKQMNQPLTENLCNSTEILNVQPENAFTDCKNESVFSDPNDVLKCNNQPDVSDKHVIHPKHGTSKVKYTGREGMLSLQVVDFPNYRSELNQISVSIK